MRSASQCGHSTVVQMFHLKEQNVDLKPDGDVAMCLKLCYPGLSAVEAFRYEGNDSHDGALQCALSAWSFVLHKSVWEDAFASDFENNFGFFKVGAKPPAPLFQRGLHVSSHEVFNILTEEEEKQRRNERRERVERISGFEEGKQEEQIVDYIYNKKKARRTF